MTCFLQCCVIIDHLPIHVKDLEIKTTIFEAIKKDSYYGDVSIFMIQEIHNAYTQVCERDQ